MSVEVRATTTPSILMSAGSLTHVKLPDTSYGGVGYTIGEVTSRLDDTRTIRVPVLEKNIVSSTAQFVYNDTKANINK